MAISPETGTELEMGLMNFRFKFLVIMKHKVGNSKNTGQQNEAVTSLSLHFWCSLLYLDQDNLE